MTIITKETKEMGKTTVNYLEMYLEHIKGYKEYKKAKNNHAVKADGHIITAQ